MNGLDLIVLAAFGTLLVELTCLPIPSEASTWQLLATSEDGRADDELARARRSSRLRKLLVYLLPTALGVGLFLMPLAVVFGWVGVDLVPRAAAVWLQAFGAGLVVGGRVLTLWSVLQLRAQRRAGGGPPGGLFRRSRNPGLVGMFAFYLGLCCLFPGVILWLGVPLYFGNMHRRVRLEEAHLRARHGIAWRDYEHRVPRYLPFPGLR